MIYSPHSGVQETAGSCSSSGEVQRGLTRVKDLKLTHKNYGAVQFWGEIDIRGMDFPKCVTFAHLTVAVGLILGQKWSSAIVVTNVSTLYIIARDILHHQVYPETLWPNPPPRGTMLNRASRVSIFHCGGDLPSKTASAKKKLLERVQSLTASIGAKFVSFDFETGTWVFDVEYFW